MTGGARPSAAADSSHAAGPQASQAKARRVEQRPTKKKSRGTAGLWEMGCVAKQQKEKGKVFYFRNQRLKHDSNTSLNPTN
jgi:hypothetical protein